MPVLPSVVLRSYTPALLQVVQPWFHHPEVVRWLGGPEWPARELQLLDSGLGEMFRGRRVLRTHSWVAFDEAGNAVAKIGGDVYDRWCQYTEDLHGAAVTSVEPGPAMGLAYVVDSRQWRRGFGTATLLAAMDAPEVADVVLFAAGIEADNVASARCAAAAGLVPDSAVPDWEGIIYHVRRREPPAHHRRCSDHDGNL
jgi:RimJ/RimL family protein N-acetyltransferase